jgi:hypothetical protein
MLPPSKKFLLRILVVDDWVTKAAIALAVAKTGAKKQSNGEPRELALLIPVQWRREWRPTSHGQ